MSTTEPVDPIFIEDLRSMTRKRLRKFLANLKVAEHCLRGELQVCRYQIECAQKVLDEKSV